MNPPPSSTTKPTSSTSTSTSTPNSSSRCDDCNSRDCWVIHTVRLRGNLRSFCTHCLLRNHPASFCPSCFVFYDSSPPHPSRRVSCSNCLSLTHTQCASASSDAKPPSSYLCPPCRNPNSFSFFKPIVGENGGRFVDKSLAEAFYCAAKIACSSMNKAVSAAKCDFERRGRETALARKRAREALEDVVMLDAKEKASSVIPKLKEASIEKPNGNKNNGGMEKQKQTMQLGKVKQETDGSK